MRILGLDVSRGRVSACLLTEKVDRPRDWFQQYRSEIEDYPTTQAGLAKLLELKPEIAVLEPTGIHYSKFWADNFDRLGIPVLWVGHSQLRSYRITLRLPSKNDYADAFALAYYAFDKLPDQKYFLQWSTHGLAAEIRELCLQIRHLERLTVPLKNRIRQNLCHEWPEVAACKTTGPLWGFCAGTKISKCGATRYQRLLEISAGTGLSEFTKYQATQLVALEVKIQSLETLLIELTSRADFHRYQAVFRQFGFGPRVGALILSHCYPLENFLGPEKREIVEVVRGANGKPSKRYRSLNSFKLMLGLGLVEDSSGKVKSWIPGGSVLCRTAIWQFIFTRIEVKSARPKNDFGKELGDYCDLLKETKVSKKLVRAKVARKLVEKLFYALLNSVV